MEFPDLPGEVVDAAIDAELKYKIPAESVITKPDQWKNLMDMQIYLGNAKGSVPFDQIIDNSFAEKAIARRNELEAMNGSEPSAISAGPARASLLSAWKLSKSYVTGGKVTPVIGD